MADYRWNTSPFAEGYDAAAPQIHPYYVAVQQEIVSLLTAFSKTRTAAELLHVVDLGGGSGRLLEKVLAALPQATATIIDQSEPFLAIAERRLAPFSPRVTFAI